MDGSNKSQAPALDRGIDVVEFMAARQEPLSFSEILAAMHIPRASLVRILNTLVNRGFIDKLQENGRYRLGMKLLYLGHRLQDKIRLRTLAVPFMQQLSQLTRETVELSTLDQDQLVLLDQIEGQGDVRLYSRVGAAYPYFHVVAVGKLYLAHMEPTKRRRSLQKIGLPAVTGNSITDLEVLEQELATILETGYAVEDQELRKGVRRVVAPIFDHTGALAGCLGVAAPIFRLSTEDFPRVGKIVRGVADEVSASLGSGVQQVDYSKGFVNAQTGG